MTKLSRIAFARILTAGALVLTAVTCWAVTGNMTPQTDLVVKTAADAKV